MGLYGYFSEWANEIMTQKFVPQQGPKVKTEIKSFYIF